MSHHELHRIIYISTATQPMSESELSALLKKSRLKNRFLNITGYMIYYEGTILQLIEGSKTSVEYMYNTIIMDERHHNSVELCSETIEERLFTDWQMGFRKIDREQLKHIQSVNDLFAERLSDTQLKKFCRTATAIFDEFLNEAKANKFQLLPS